MDMLDAVYHEPNAETVAAMKEAQSGALRTAPALNLSSIEAMEKSMGLWKNEANKKRGLRAVSPLKRSAAPVGEVGLPTSRL